MCIYDSLAVGKETTSVMNFQASTPWAYEATQIVGALLNAECVFLRRPIFKPCFVNVVLVTVEPLCTSNLHQLCQERIYMYISICFVCVCVFFPRAVLVTHFSDFREFACLGMGFLPMWWAIRKV